MMPLTQTAQPVVGEVCLDLEDGVLKCFDGEQWLTINTTFGTEEIIIEENKVKNFKQHFDASRDVFDEKEI
jgi:hypothetical protein